MHIDQLKTLTEIQYKLVTGTRDKETIISLLDEYQDALAVNPVSLKVAKHIKDLKAILHTIELDLGYVGFLTSAMSLNKPVLDFYLPLLPEEEVAKWFVHAVTTLTNESEVLVNKPDVTMLDLTGVRHSANDLYCMYWEELEDLHLEINNYHKLVKLSDKLIAIRNKLEGAKQPC